MDWTSNFIKAINYIEDNLLEDIDTNKVADSVFISSFYFQKVFSIYTGYSVAEYIRNRRLYQAAVEIRSSKTNIIDIAYKYGYETPESFTKAFTKFHGVTPSKSKDTSCPIKIFLPLRINISIEGGDKMDYKVEKIENLKFVGFEKEIPSDQGYIECPKFWDEVNEKYFSKINDGSKISEFLKENNLGEFAVCYDGNNNTFKYMIACLYNGKGVPEGLVIKEFPNTLWVKFKSIGPLPGALQALNTKIWTEWIPNNPEYELAFNADIEWYSSNDVMQDNYECEIWLPVIHK